MNHVMCMTHMNMQHDHMNDSYEYENSTESCHMKDSNEHDYERLIRLCATWSYECATWFFAMCTMTRVPFTLHTAMNLYVFIYTHTQQWIRSYGWLMWMCDMIHCDVHHDSTPVHIAHGNESIHTFIYIYIYIYTYIYIHDMTHARCVSLLCAPWLESRSRCTCEWVMRHMCIRHVAHEERVMSRCVSLLCAPWLESCCTSAACRTCSTSRTAMNHVAHRNTSCRT